jgi:hypothetical protein
MKRAREQNVEAAGQEGEAASAHHHDDHTTTASPNKKKPRRGGGLVDDDDEDEGGSIEEWNLLCDLPYVAFRHLLDFLSSCPANAGAAPFFRYLKLLFSY